MAATRKTKAREAQLAFEALSIEGGLVSPEWLSKVAQLQAPAQAEADYRIPKGLNLRDEIGRYWRIAQAHWADFKAGREAKADAKATAERFVLALLRDAFGFTVLVPVEPAVLQERAYPIGYATLGGRVPVVVAPADGGLDTLSAAFGDGARRRSAFGLAQEYLNAKEGALWGVASDGVSLRIVRDNASLTRPAWIETDIQRIFTEDRYADFAAFWLLCHETRFGREGQPVTDCALEAWRRAGRDEGTRAREHLRRGVEEALRELGQGFLSHAENIALRADLQSGALPVKDYFNQLLRLVYRLIFLLTVEERNLLHPDGASDATKALYANGYGIRRLRERSVKRNAHDRFSDLWEATKIVCRGLAVGEPRLGLPALAGIFAANQCPALDGAKLENRALLLAVFKLAWLREGGSLSRVNWRDMGPEELGSVYESLLELVPQIAKDGRQFAFATGGETKANARKTTSSYYTHDSLVQILLDSAFEPVIAETIAKNPGTTVEALLDLSIVDPACGSGHFLLAAARRLAAHVARLRANGTPSAGEYRHALRQVVGRCIFGVDLNPMAVELCKVGLWMEAVEPGLPLSFLNSHIQYGNALLGTTRELMAKGIPDAAWDPIEGDDKKTASALKKRSKKAAEGQRSLDTLWTKPADTEAQTVARAVTELDAASDADVEALAKKEQRWDGILGSPEYRHQKFVADAWCASFVWPKQPGELTDAAPTNELWRQLRDAQGNAPAVTRKTVSELAEQYRFFHWHLQFPQVFAKGGFDVVLGNPPWDALSPDVKEFFSQWAPGVRFASPEEQGHTIAQLRAQPSIDSAWVDHCRRLYGTGAFIKESGRYRMFAPGNLGKGDFNVFRMFVELALTHIRSGGRAAQVVPEGLYNGANCMKIREELFEKFDLEILYGFENHRHAWFEGVDTRAKLAIYVAHFPGRTEHLRAAFNIRSQSELLAISQGAMLALPVGLIREFSPDALAIMEFANQGDVDIARKIYEKFPKFGDASAGTPYREFLYEFDMNDDKRLLGSDPAGLPLYEGRMVAQYDHRAKRYVAGRGRQADWLEQDFEAPEKAIGPQWRVAEVPQRARERIAMFRVGFCDVASPTNERSLVAAILPPRTIACDKVPTIVFRRDNGSCDPEAMLAWVAIANSSVMDWLVRKKISLKMSYTVLDSLPFPRRLESRPLWQELASRVLRLTCTSPEMVPLWNELGGLCGLPTAPRDSVPGAVTDGERLALAAEIDALVAHDLFGLTKNELEHVLDSFPIVEKRDIKIHGEYRTKRVTLAAYDVRIEAARTGKSQETRLSPPAVEPGVTCSPRGDGKVVSLPAKAAAWAKPAVGPAGAVVPDLAALPANAWTRPHTMERGEIQAAIVAVLKANGEPMDRRQARLASLLCLEPHLLASMLDKTETAQWVRVVGGDAMKAASASIDATAQEWGRALSQLRGSEKLNEDLQQNTWSLGTGTFDTIGWPEGRAGFVVNVLRRLQQSTQVDAVIRKLPGNVQQWLANAG